MGLKSNSATVFAMPHAMTTCVSVCTNVCVCVLKPHVESSFSSPLGYRAALSNANNAVVIVVFTSIKSWQLFLPALPKKAASFTAASTALTAIAASCAPSIAIMQIRIADYQITNCNGSNCFVYSWHMAHANGKVGRQIVTQNEQLNCSRGAGEKVEEAEETVASAKPNCLPYATCNTGKWKSEE